MIGSPDAWAYFNRQPSAAQTIKAIVRLAATTPFNPD
jgi:hypothetical protein